LNFIIHDDESLEDLQINQLYILQKKTEFRFGMDAVLLANFVMARLGARIIDLGTGTGILPLLISAKTQAERIIGIEIQHEIAEMAKRSVTGNALDDRIEIMELDIKACVETLGSCCCDVVVSNPPYTKVGSGLVNPDSSKAIARHEILCSLRDIVMTAAALLKNHGEFYMVHRPDRLCDIMTEMRNARIEPKLLRLVCPRLGQAPSLILVSGMKNGNPGMKHLPPLFIYTPSGDYSEEARVIYGGSI